jgi:hypothetical protein
MVIGMSRALGFVGAPLFVLAASWTTAGLGETMRDPTQPPAMQMAKAGKTSSTPYTGPGLVVRSIRIGPAGRLAMIGGVGVKVGDSLGEAKVIAIRESEVVLREPQGSRTLKLYPGVDKHAHSDMGNQLPVAVVAPRKLAHSGDHTP